MPVSYIIIFIQTNFQAKSTHVHMQASTTIIRDFNGGALSMLSWQLGTEIWLRMCNTLEEPV